jgi:hypothetical protein
MRYQQRSKNSARYRRNYATNPTWRPTLHPAVTPLTTPVTLSCGLTVLSPHIFGALCAPCAIATVKVPGARAAALKIRPNPLAARRPTNFSSLSFEGANGECESDGLGPAAAGRSFPTDWSFSEGFSVLFWPTYGTRTNSEPISPIPLNVS